MVSDITYGLACDIYCGLLGKQVTDYIDIVKCILQTRKEDEFALYAIMRDRGEKADYVQADKYDTSLIQSELEKLQSQGRWFYSMYLNWIINETGVLGYDLRAFDVFASLIEKDLYRKILSDNRFECYGFSMSAVTILDKAFLLNYEDERKKVLIRLALEGICSYLYFHRGKNVLWDAEMYSCYARLFDRFRGYLTTILLDLGCTPVFQYGYCFGMYQAYKCLKCLPLCKYKYDYYANALMMQQNQTVVGVTGDSMDANLHDAVSFGKKQIDHFFIKVLNGNWVENNDLCGMAKFINALNDEFKKQTDINPGLQFVRCLERYFQIEPYELAGIVEQACKKLYIPFDRLLLNLGLSEQNCEKMEKNGVLQYYIHGLSLSYPLRAIRVNLLEPSPKISCLWVSMENNGSIKDIMVYGSKLHKLFLDIRKTKMFYDIPCAVCIEDKIGGIDRLYILIGLLPANSC